MKKLVGVRSNSARHWVGDGFPVRSIFSYQHQPEELSPFLLLDYAGPTEFSPTDRRRGVGEHPHRGFETVTIVYSGEVEHRDSAGGGGSIGPGDVQWMTAGAGIVHEEFHGIDFARKGGRFEMIQLWVNLPARDKMAPPTYQGIRAADIPMAALDDDAGSVRVIAGTFGGVTGPATTFSPVNLWDLRLNPSHRARFTVPAGHTTALLVMQGALGFGQTRIGEGELALLERDGETVEFDVKDDSIVLFLGGEPLNEPVVGYGPFVMNTPAEIQQAFSDYQRGLMGTIAAQVS